MSVVTEEMTAPWNETTLSTLLSNYKLENVFSADEFGLLYICLTNFFDCTMKPGMEIPLSGAY